MTDTGGYYGRKSVQPIRLHCNTPEATEPIGQEPVLSKVALILVIGSRRFLLSVLTFRTE